MDASGGLRAARKAPKASAGPTLGPYLDLGAYAPHRAKWTDVMTWRVSPGAT